MRIADQWKDYEIIDTSKGEKLERWGDVLLIRPDPQIIWNTPRNAPCLEKGGCQVYPLQCGRRPLAKSNLGSRKNGKSDTGT